MKRLLSIFLAALMLTLNVGVTYAAHYCEGKIVKQSVSVAIHDMDCGMGFFEQICEKESSVPVFQKPDCCTNEYIQVKMDEEFDNSKITHPNFQWSFIAAFVTSYITVNSGETTFVQTIGYAPPLPDRDIPVLIQSFLI